MASAGELVVTLTADQGDFVAGMKDAGEKVDEFGDKVSKGGEHAHKFSVHMLTSRHAVGTFASVIGSASGPLMHFIHAFEIAGPAFGAAIVGLLLYREAIESSEKATEAATAKAKKYFDVTMKISELKGLRSPLSAEGAELKKNLEEAGTDIVKIQEKLEESAAKKQGENLWFNPYLSTTDIFTKTEAQMREIVRAGEEEDQVRINKLKANIKDMEQLQREGFTKSGFGSGGGPAKAVSGGQLGYFRLEHDATQVDLLTQIANNTAKAAATKDDSYSPERN